MEGILLYYKYVDLSNNRGEIHEWMKGMCERLQLKGRVRVAYDGVNVTVGGSWSALQEHIKEVQEQPVLQGGAPIDFKLAESSGPCSQQTVQESKFNTLVVQLCKELVTLGPKAQGCADPWRGTATHLSPQEFHDMLQQGRDGGNETVLLDTRNFYETCIGHFKVDGIPLLDPHTRCFSSFPDWVDTNLEQLRSKKVMMYCTGGVRCERASAYLKSKGPAFQDVYQLQGGIQRYLEAFPNGGFFQGKNFVYDERQAVGSLDPTIVGSCTICGTETDDYGSRARCRQCRMLLLVCTPCQEGPQERLKNKLFCQLCLEQNNASKLVQPAQTTFGAEPKNARLANGAGDDASNRKLRILCLHGFRQTAKQFQGRTCALRKKLKNVADFTFVDAPHLLPFYYKPREGVDPPQQLPFTSATSHEGTNSAVTSSNPADGGLSRIMSSWEEAAVVTNSPHHAAVTNQDNNHSSHGIEEQQVGSSREDAAIITNSPHHAAVTMQDSSHGSQVREEQQVGSSREEAAVITNSPHHEAVTKQDSSHSSQVIEEQQVGSSREEAAIITNGPHHAAVTMQDSSHSSKVQESSVRVDLNIVGNDTVDILDSDRVHSAGYDSDSVYTKGHDNPSTSARQLDRDMNIVDVNGSDHVCTKGHDSQPITSSGQSDRDMKVTVARPKRAWLVIPEQYQTLHETQRAALQGPPPTSTTHSSQQGLLQQEHETQSAAVQGSLPDPTSHSQQHQQEQEEEKDKEQEVRLHAPETKNEVLQHSLLPNSSPFTEQQGSYPHAPETKKAALHASLPDSTFHAVQPAWQVAPEGLDEHQWERQVCGASESLATLKEVLERHGPFDGVLAFSQGCAMATGLSALLQLQQHKSPTTTAATQTAGATQTTTAATQTTTAATQTTAAAAAAPPKPENVPTSSNAGDTPPRTPAPATFQHTNSSNAVTNTSCADTHGDSAGLPPSLTNAGVKAHHEPDTGSIHSFSIPQISHPAFKFAILSSGYPPACPQLQALIRECGVISMPSLHIVGQAGVDTQVSDMQSRALAELFDPETCSVMHHQFGHVIPSSKTSVNAILAFLNSVRERAQVN